MERLRESDLFCQSLAADPEMTEEKFWRRLDEPDPLFPDDDLPRILDMKVVWDALMVIRAREFSRLDLDQDGRSTAK